jgi:hypothetical protein
MNFDNFIDVTCILHWHIGNFKFAFRYKNWLSKLHALTTGRLYLQNSLVTAHSLRPTCAVAIGVTGILHWHNANLIFPICKCKMQVTHIKLSKFISSRKILNANQMLISYFPHITSCIKKKN